MSTLLDDQIKNRIQHDNDMFSDAFASLSEVISDGAFHDMFSDSRKASMEEALGQILSYYGFKAPFKIPDSITDEGEYLDYALNPIGMMRRTVKLDEKWYKDAFGAYLGVLDKKYSAALIPSFSGYMCISPATGERFTVNRKNAGRIGAYALCFYPPLPDKPIGAKEMFKHILFAVTASDVVKLIVLSLAITLISMLTPFITQYLFDNVALQPSVVPLVSIFVFMVTIYISTTVLEIGKSLLISGISTKADVILSSSVLMRMLNLSPSFFKNYNSGDLQTRLEGSRMIASSTIDIVFGSGISVLMSFVYLFQIRTFSAVLVVPSIIIVLVLSVFSVFFAVLQTGRSKEQQSILAKESGFLISIINGIEKIRLSGAEKRVFSKWSDIYKKRAQLEYNPPSVLAQNMTITTLLTMAGSLILYFFALKANIDSGTYMGYIASYGLLSGAFVNLASSITMVSYIKAQIDLFRPILREVPESAASKKSIKRLTGQISLNQVSFRYYDNQPLVIDNLSLSVKAGEYLGIVGKSGCGKSTLMRLLLGFEKPIRGIVSYDSIDFSSLDPRSVRRQIGCVLQDSGLFTDSIRNNITLGSPLATDDDVWEAARMAGIDEDIKAMPMGLETIVFDSSSTISGGQKQRILIARALINKPNILFLDEATSALDNITQKIVTDTFASLDCTRIVIAHRLSTVKQCDRIVMLEGGRIIEEGTYDELMAMNGRFAEMVSRQLQ